MTEPSTLADQLDSLVSAAERDGGTLRFSKYEGKYQWGHVSTNSVQRMQFLLTCWNHRHEIIRALRGASLPRSD